MNKTKKNNKTDKNFITFNKYELNNFGIKNNMYVIKFNHPYKCKKNITLKKRMDYFKKYLVQNFNIQELLKNNKVLSKKIYKNKNLMQTIIDLMDREKKYTYCLNKDNLILIETFKNDNYSVDTIIKDLTSKHVIYCNKDACASGEMVIYNNSFIFNNSSGTFMPSLKDIQSLKDALPFMNIKIIDIKSKLNEKYFGKFIA